MKRRRRFGCGAQLLALLILVAAVIGVVYGTDALLFAPWAYGILGQPTLTGSWDGGLRTLGGEQYWIYLQLDRSRSSRGTPLNSRGRADIEGHISWCARRMPSTTSTYFGSANRSASNVRFEVDEAAHPHPGLLPFQFSGAWHGSTLVLNVKFQLYRGHSYVYSSAIPDERKAVRLPLHKGGVGTYEARCARL